LANGTVKWFNATKGFGFIAPANGGKDVFVHISAMERAGIRQLEDGQPVKFDIEADRNGRESASNLVLAGGAPSKKKGTDDPGPSRNASG
jgi:cold shock protein